jgi:DDE superfamily endonuclease
VELCENAGVRLEFLPPYSPDFNPIEEAFAELKAWMRKNNALQSGYDDFEGFLEAGMQYMSRKPGKHFRSCHIQI